MKHASSRAPSGHRAPGTALRRQLEAGPPAPRPTAIDAFELARSRFVAGERIDMGALADELGVNRVTLYRWVGTREQLLVEILWSFAPVIFEQERETAHTSGVERIVAVMSRLARGALTEPGVVRFLSEEGELAMRLLTRRDGGFQPRLIEAVRALLDEEVEAGRVSLPLASDEVAFIVVRLLESYIYLDLILGEQPDAERAEDALRMLLS